MTEFSLVHIFVAKSTKDNMDFYLSSSNALGSQGLHGSSPFVYGSGMRGYYPTPFYPLGTTCSLHERSTSANRFPSAAVRSSNTKVMDARTTPEQKDHEKNSGKNLRVDGITRDAPSENRSDKNDKRLSDDEE
ncbi:hypothetical protein QZH41_009048, partial [Actinostola sp. cb2023]